MSEAKAAKHADAIVYINIKTYVEGNVSYLLLLLYLVSISELKQQIDVSI